MFKGCRNSIFLADCHKGEGIILPELFVKVYGKKTAGLILKHGIDAYGYCPVKMSSDNIIGQWRKLSGFAFAAFYRRFSAKARLPLIFTDRAVSFIAILA